VAVDGKVAALAAQQHGAVSRGQAGKVGLSARMVAARLAAGVFTEPVPGVLVLTGAPKTYEQKLMVAILASTKGAVASRRSAAALHGLDGCPEAHLELTVIRRGRTRDPAATLHRVAALEEADRVIVRGVPSTTLARTLADLGSVVSERAVLKALDSALRTGTSRIWLRQTAKRLHRPGQRGTATLHRLLDQLDVEGTVPASWLERLVEELVATSGLPPLVRQHEIRDGSGRFIARADGAYPSIKLGFEAHSRRFHFGLGPAASDEDRDLRAAAVGWELLYLGHRHTQRPEAVARLVAAAVRRRAKLFA
jgi:hypothetical protein